MHKIFQRRRQGTSFDGRLTWVAGAYLLVNPAPIAKFQTVTLGNATAVAVGSNLHDEALYAQGTYDLSSWVEGLKFTAGIRYTWDDPKSVTQTVDGAGNCVAPCSFSVKEHLFTATTWTVGLDYQLVPGTMVYATARKGFRGGGFNNLAPTPSLLSYAPETVTDQELGVKSDWTIAELPVRTNAAFFHEDYANIQSNQLVNGAPGQPATYQLTNNAAAARILGAEFEGSIAVTDDLEFGADFAWLDFEYTAFQPGVDAALYNRSTLYLRPKFKYGLSTRYRIFADPAAGDISVSARWDWQSTVRTSPASALPDIGAYQSPYGLLTLSADWKRVGGQRHPLNLGIAHPEGFRARPRQPDGGAATRCRRHLHRQNQHAGIWFWLSYLQPRL
jgi:iron complex outermembrane receptor protein